MDLRRPMILGMFDKGALDHSKVRLIYFSKMLRIKQRAKLLVRVFSIDLYIDKESDKNILSIEGPLSSNVCVNKNYKCKKYFTVSNLSINDLINISQQTMDTHGKYNHATNNCRDFSKKLMENINTQSSNVNSQNSVKNNINFCGFADFNNNEKIKLITNSNDCWELQTYINEYYENNFKKCMDNDSNTHQDGNNINGKHCSSFSRSKHGSYDKSGHFIESQAISLEQVKKEFHLRYKYNNLRIIRQGNLKRKSRILGRWNKVWCVLTVNQMLYIFADYKMIDLPEDMIQIKGQIVEPDDENREKPKNNIFYVNNGVFEAESNESLQRWIKTIRYYGGKSAITFKKPIVTCG